MKNQKPFMFLSKKGKLYAEVKMHNLDEGTVRTINHEEECLDDVEKLAYNECVLEHRVVSLGIIIAEPIA